MHKLKALSRTIVQAGAYGPLPERYTVIGVNLMSLAIIAINLTVGPVFYLVTRRWPVLAGSMTEALFIAGIILLNARRLHYAANLLFFLILNWATLYFASILGKDVNAQLMIIWLLGLSLFLFNDLRIQISCIAITGITLFFLELNYKKGFIPALPLKRTSGISCDGPPILR